MAVGRSSSFIGRALADRVGDSTPLVEVAIDWELDDPFVVDPVPRSESSRRTVLPRRLVCCWPKTTYRAAVDLPHEPERVALYADVGRAGTDAKETRVTDASDSAASRSSECRVDRLLPLHSCQRSRQPECQHGVGCRCSL